LLREWHRETALLKSGGENDLSPEAYASQTAEEEAGQAHFQYWLGSDDKTIRLAERDRVAWLIAETIGRSLVEADISVFHLHGLVTDGSENSKPLG
jgi:hypothetical protein